MTGRERAQLRSQAHALEPIVHIGKEGVTENVVRQADDALTARELIKGTVQQNAPLSAGEASSVLCEKTGAEPISTTGRRFVIYRYSPKKHERGG
ncbi:MAG: YhbY family RNA-binding protein [Clostridia bacterium]|nr:YhbY family RNA-binding protein [Clostridia bacterium]